MTSQEAVKILLKENQDKVSKALRLFFHSVNKAKPFDPACHYSFDELEPYDALASRFERLVDLIQGPFLKSLETVKMGVFSEVLRDRLCFAEKQGLIRGVEIWLDMRNLRNRIAHDYLSERLKVFYDLITGTYREELEFFAKIFKECS